jgi:uncharacterized membrane protein
MIIIQVLHLTPAALRLCGDYGSPAAGAGEVCCSTAREVAEMKALVAPVLVLILLAGLAVAQRAYYTPRLPPQVAAHIGSSGTVDRWEEKADFVDGISRGWVTVPAIFGGIGLLAVLAVRFFPYQLVNIPNKDYWLASPRRRREAAMVVLNFALWLVVAGVAFVIGLTQAMIQATFSGKDSITLPFLAGFIVFLVAQIVLLLIRLSRGHQTRRSHREGHA